MTHARLLWLSLLLVLATVPGCAETPERGCLLAVANPRETFRARAYLHPAIAARVLRIHFYGQAEGHAALIYRIVPEGWQVYDCLRGSRALDVPNTPAFPDPTTAARQSFPGWPVSCGEWYPTAPHR